MQHPLKCTCKYCEDEFTPDRNNKEYCSKSCRLADEQRMLEKFSDALEGIDDYKEERDEYYDNIKQLL